MVPAQPKAGVLERLRNSLSLQLAARRDLFQRPDLDLKEHLRLTGFTGEEKAPTEVIVAVVVVDTLSGIVMVDGEIVIVKSGDGPDDTTVKVKTVEWVSVPFDPDTMRG